MRQGFRLQRYVQAATVLAEASPSLLALSKERDQSALAACLSLSSKTNSPFLGTQTHGQIIKLGFCNAIFSLNNLLVMYSRCGLLNNAFELFDQMPERNIVSWTAVISGAIQNGEFETGLQLYVQMMRSGSRPNEFTLGSVFQACSNAEAFEVGPCLHGFAFKSGMEANPFVGNSLAYTYAKYRDIKAAEDVFQCLRDPDAACWNAMIGSYFANGYGHEAVKLVSTMHRQGVVFDRVTYMKALKACFCAGDVNFGQQVHVLVIKNEMVPRPSVMNSLMRMYFKVGLKNCALKIFDRLKERDVISWNTVITGFADDENVGEVVSLFSDMLFTGLKPTEVTFSVIFRMAGALQNFAAGYQFCSIAYHLGLPNNILVANSLINMFSRCAEVGYASYIFENLPVKSVISWNEMLAGYCLNDRSVNAFMLFHNLREAGVEQDEFTYSSILGACSEADNAELGRQFHASTIKSGFDSNCFVGSSLINAYARFANIDDLYKIFHSIKEPDIASWGSMMSAFLQQGHSNEALLFLGFLREAGEQPDEFILGSALNACADLTSFGLSKCIHSFVLKAGYHEQLHVVSSVMNAYAKCGDIACSRTVFDEFSSDRDPILYNTMISAYAQHGLYVEVVQLFEQMKQNKLKPNQATFVSVISACSHLGLVDEGRRFFGSISSDCGVSPSRDNFACFIDLLARNGFLEEAKTVIEGMPSKPWPSIWRSLLSGCRIHGKEDLAEIAASNLLQLDPDNDAAYTLVVKVLSENGRWQEVEKVKRVMAERRIKKEVGYSWIEM